MSRRRDMLVLLLAAALAHTGPAGAQRPWDGPAPAYAATDERPEPTFAFATDPVAALISLPPLRAVRLPPGVRELRIWTGFGIVMRHDLLRVVQHGDEVAGELVLWWQSASGEVEGTAHSDLDRRVLRMAEAHGCVRDRTGDRYVEVRGGQRTPRRNWLWACRVDRAGEIDWAGVLAELDRLRAATLPDPSTLEGPGVMIHDGISVEVEVLSGGEYHTYTYSGPGYQPWPEARAAEAILDLARKVRHEVWTREDGSPSGP